MFGCRQLNCVSADRCSNGVRACSALGRPAIPGLSEDAFAPTGEAASSTLAQTSRSRHNNAHAPARCHASGLGLGPCLDAYMRRDSHRECWRRVPMTISPSDTACNTPRLRTRTSTLTLREPPGEEVQQIGDIDDAVAGHVCRTSLRARYADACRSSTLWRAPCFDAVRRCHANAVSVGEAACFGTKLTFVCSHVNRRETDSSIRCCRVINEARQATEIRGRPGRHRSAVTPINAGRAWKQPKIVIGSARDTIGSG